MLKKKTPPKPYVLPPLSSSRGSRGHLFHESERTGLIPRLVSHSKPFRCSDRWGFEYAFEHCFLFFGILRMRSLRKFLYASAECGYADLLHRRASYELRV